MNMRDDTNYDEIEMERIMHEQDQQAEIDLGFEIVSKTPYLNSTSIADTVKVHNKSHTFRGGKAISYRGFHKHFDNGWTLSVQWGSGNYCESREHPEMTRSKTAEIAVWRTKGGEWGRWEDGDTVQGWVTSDFVLELINAMQAPDWRPPRGTT